MAAFLTKLTAFASEKLTVSTVSKALTAATYDADSDVDTTADVAYPRTNDGRKARAAVVEVDGANSLRYTEEGTAPVATTTGQLLANGDRKVLESYQEIVKFRMIREGGTDAVVQVTYYR